MARDEAPPFGRGETWYGGTTPDANDLGGTNIVGKEWVFEDVDPDNPTTLRTNRLVRCRAVRNTGAFTMLAKRVASFSLVTGEYGNSVVGYVTTTAQIGFPIDEYLGSSGIVDDDIGYIIVEGPAMVTVALTAGATTNFAVGDWLVAQTAATSQATTSGRLEQIDTDAATTPLADQIIGRVGRALTAKTTANTGADVLVDIGHW